MQRFLFISFVCILLAGMGSRGEAAEGSIDYHQSPWGIASGAEWSGEFPRFNPLLREAGVTWLRIFPEWQSIEPRRGEFHWETSDRMVADAKKNGIQLIPCLSYLTPWASQDGGTRLLPVKDIAMWRDFAKACMERYKDDIDTWEVYNEFNGSFGPGGTPKIYADMVTATKEAAMSVNPAIRVGMSCANFDVNFFDAAIKQGAAGQFDFIAVHPYENLGTVMSDGSESAYLSMGKTLRAMLKANGQKEDMPLFITETGFQTRQMPDAVADERQAEALVKVYILSMAAGFSQIDWFEARGPAYGQGTDHGIIREDWSTRPAYTALKTMTQLLGPTPEYNGWVAIDETGYGFVFGNTLVMWAPKGEELKAFFGQEVTVTPLDGVSAKAEEITLTNTPMFVTDVPEGVVADAKENKDQPFPWGKDYAAAEEVVCRLGATNVDDGIRQINANTTKSVHALESSWKQLDFSVGGEGRYVYFRVDPTFIPLGIQTFEISAMVRRLDAGKSAATSILYESSKGYRQPDNAVRQIEQDEWQEVKWVVTDANFAGQWGWNFRLEATMSQNEFAISEVKVRKVEK